MLTDVGQSPVFVNIEGRRCRHALLSEPDPPTLLPSSINDADDDILDADPADDDDDVKTFL